MRFLRSFHDLAARLRRVIRASQMHHQHGELWHKDRRIVPRRYVQLNADKRALCGQCLSQMIFVALEVVVPINDNKRRRDPLWLVKDELLNGKVIRDDNLLIVELEI